MGDDQSDEADQPGNRDGTGDRQAGDSDGPPLCALDVDAQGRGLVISQTLDVQVPGVPDDGGQTGEHDAADAGDKLEAQPFDGQRPH